MKKTLFAVIATISTMPLFAQTINWDLSSVTTSIKALIPTVYGVGAMIALVIWMLNNLSDNHESNKKLLSTAMYAVLMIALTTAIIYVGINSLL